jgi:hypothetical protein
MKKLIVIICLFIVNSAFAQKKHTECAAAFVGEKMIVDEYSPRGISKISKNATGRLSVNLVELGESTVVKGKAVNFLVAIEDKDTQTLTIVSNEETNAKNLKSLLKMVNVGDFIVLVATKDKYALPHHHIEITE